VRPALEDLEWRVVPATAVQFDLAGAQAGSPTRHEVVFIDSRTPDAAGLAAAAAAAGAEVHLLAPGGDGLDQIARALAGRPGLDDVHIVSHGAAGELFLGDLQLNLADLAQHQGDLDTIARALAPGSDLLLYGCDVAAGAAGDAFLDALAQVTGTAVAGSTVPVGPAALGGTWVLDRATGPIGASAVFSPRALAGVGGLLGATVQFTSSGATVNTSAGTFSIPVTLSGTPALASSTLAPGISTPDGLAVDANGNVYVNVDTANGKIEKVTPAGAVSTFASGFDGPLGSGFGPNGNLYVSNRYNGSIDEVTPAGVVSTFVAAGTFQQPGGMAFDAHGNLYVADQGTGDVYEVTPGGAVSVYASGFNRPAGIVFDQAGNLFVADIGANTIDKVAPGGGAFSTFATGFDQPDFLAIDAAGDLFVPNYGGTTVDEVTPAGVVNPYASGLSAPTAVAFDAAGNLYVSDYNASQVVEVSSSVSVPFTLSGAAGAYSGVTASPIVFAPGQTTAYITGTLVDPGSGVPDKTLVVILDAPSNAALGSIATEALTIHDSDAAPSVQFFSTDAGSVTLPAASFFSIPLTLSEASAATTIIPFTLSGTAVAGKDYTLLTTGTVFIPAGQTFGAIEGTVLDPGGETADPTLTATLGTPTGATLGAIASSTLTFAHPVATTTLSSTGPSVYGQEVTLTATVSSGGSPVTAGTVTFMEGGAVLAGPTPLDANGQAKFSTNALSAGGSPHQITAVYSGAAPYLVSSGTLHQTVTPAPLTVTADDQSRVFGQPNPPLTVTYSGFVLGQGPADLGGTLKVSTTATATSRVSGGPYPVVASGLTSTNYAITFKPGKLAVTPAPLKLTLPVENLTSEGAAWQALGSFKDNGADSWAVTVAYGDGTQGPAAVADMAFTLQHTYAGDQTYVVTVTVRDNFGDEASASFLVDDLIPGAQLPDPVQVAGGGGGSSSAPGVSAVLSDVGGSAAAEVLVAAVPAAVMAAHPGLFPSAPGSLSDGYEVRAFDVSASASAVVTLAFPAGGVGEPVVTWYDPQDGTEHTLTPSTLAAGAVQVNASAHTVQITLDRSSLPQLQLTDGTLFTVSVGTVNGAVNVAVANAVGRALALSAGSSPTFAPVGLSAGALGAGSQVAPAPSPAAQGPSVGGGGAGLVAPAGTPAPTGSRAAAAARPNLQEDTRQAALPPRRAPSLAGTLGAGEDDLGAERVVVDRLFSDLTSDLYDEKAVYGRMFFPVQAEENFSLEATEEGTAEEFDEFMTTAVWFVLTTVAAEAVMSRS
jgi:sugar lactone lactonase YvrE